MNVDITLSSTHISDFLPSYCPYHDVLYYITPVLTVEIHICTQLPTKLKFHKEYGCHNINVFERKSTTISANSKSAVYFRLVKSFRS